MARKPSALKAQRASIRRRIDNHRRSLTVDRLLREYRKTDQSGAKLAQNLQQALDKAAGRQVIHHRRVDRIKSRLARRTAITKIAKQ